MKIHNAHLLLVFAIIFSSCLCQGQGIKRFNSFSYNVNEGLLQSTIADMAYDKNNFCWISFPNGIQKFDGRDFTRVPVQAGLPDDKLVNFFRCSSGELLISHTQGISRYDINTDRFIQITAIQQALKIPLQFVGEDENIIYFYNESGNITGIDSRTFRVVKQINTGFPGYSFKSDYRPVFSTNIINHKVAVLIRFSLYLLDLQKGKILSNSAPVNDIILFSLRLKTENEVLYVNYRIKNALVVYNFITKKNTVLPVKAYDDYITRCIIFPWHNKTLISVENRLYETDTSLQNITSEIVNFQNQPIAGAAGISKIKEDNYGNLCIATVNSGIRKIVHNTYPIKYYGTELKENKSILSILPDKNSNRILAGTNDNGLLIFDTLQRLVKHIKTLPGTTSGFGINTIIKADKNRYLLFVTGEKKAWWLDGDILNPDPLIIEASIAANTGGISYFGNPLFQDEKMALTQSQENFYKTNYQAHTISEYKITSGYTMSGLFYNSCIITHADDELIFVDTATLKEYKRIPFKNTGYVRCFTKDMAGNIYVGSNKGIFRIDSTGNIRSHLNKENGLPDECIYAMAFDDEGFLWCSSNKGIFKINKDNSILQLKKEDGLQENEFNTNVVAKTSDGELFFGGVNGVSSFFPKAMTNVDDKPEFLFTKIKINNEDFYKDTAVWNIRKLDLSHNENSLSFDFIAMAKNNPGQYIYQYRMDGIDKGWIQNNELQTVRYFLQPGKYVFKVYASRLFDNNAKPLKEILIIIHPPFWKTWWFIAGISTLLLSLLIYAINNYNKRKYIKKLAVLKTEHTLRLERERISRDLHDNIGAYANAVLYSTELLEKEKDAALRDDLMKDLRFASKDIITSLRETIWALKKDNYTAEDCLLRIRNFIQPLTRYYRQIHFRIEGEAPADLILHYTKSLSLVRIVQEAVTNAIKHADAGTISIISNDKNKQWELTITDDGKGFDLQSAEHNEQGNGLNNMKQRAADAGFILNINSKGGTGTSVNIRL